MEEGDGSDEDDEGDECEGGGEEDEMEWFLVQVEMKSKSNYLKATKKTLNKKHYNKTYINSNYSHFLSAT